ncbi:MAG: M28 family peptidase [Crocinitomicaceae bacterium]|nr:MAG: M28 family peptidase [Crocinitomicaceae bacterium]
MDKSKIPSKQLRQITSTRKLTVEVVAKLNPKPAYIFTENVMAFVEGSDPVLKEEVIVVSAHYDHIGRVGNKIFNGADDNATGTAALLEMAQAFQVAKDQGKNPKRSYLFVALTGEEMGLLGSAYYVSNPWIPLSNTITDLNIDMVGRTTKPTEKDTFAVYLIGSNRLSNELHLWSEQANKLFCQLQLDYTYNDLNDPLRLYYRSDHYNFAKNGIPSIFYFGGFHDDYHRETDEIETINFDKLRAVTSLVFHTAWMLGNADHRPTVNH